MNETKRKRLVEAGYHATTVADFLGLSTEQNELIEIRLALTSALKKQRGKSSLSQSRLAEKIGSSQSRVAKMEAGDPHVSLDLMIRALLAAGMTRGEIAETICGTEGASPGRGTLTPPNGSAAEPPARRTRASKQTVA